jgi:hypothetical protein
MGRQEGRHGKFVIIRPDRIPAISTVMMVEAALLVGSAGANTISLPMQGSSGLPRQEQRRHDLPIESMAGVMI